MRWSFILVSYFSLLCLGLADNIRGPLFPEVLKVFGLSDTTGSWMFALTSFFGMTGGLSAGWILRHWDRVRSLRFSLWMCFVALVGMGAAPHFWLLLFFSALLGFSFGLMGVCQNVLASIGAPVARRRQVLAGLHSMYGLASFAAPLVVAFATPAFESWRAPFFISSLAPLAVLFYAYFQVSTETKVAATADPAGVESVRPYRRAGVIWIASALACYTLCEILVSSRLALFLRRENGADLSASSWAVTWFFLLLLVGRVFFSFVHVPMSLRNQAAIALAASLALLGWGISGHTEGFIFSGLTMALIYPTLVAMMAEEFPDHLNAAMSVLLALQFMFTVVMHLSVGWMTDVYGIRAAFLIGPSALLIAIFLVLSYGPLFHRHSARV